MSSDMSERWAAGEPYERYVGRWSRQVARDFLQWLAVPPGQIWGDVGCGTGALAAGILAGAAPQAVLAIDRSIGFLRLARGLIADPRARFSVADAAALPWANGSCAAVVSGLMLNFVPDAAATVYEMARAAQPGGRVAAYVWDYRSGMEMMRHFWDVAIEISPQDAALDEAERFAICDPEALRALFQGVGLSSVAVRAISIPTVFRDFDDYWTPFLGGQGSAPTYLAGLDDERRERLREALRARLAAGDGPIAMRARAWAAQGSAPA